MGKIDGQTSRQTERREDRQKDRQAGRGRDKKTDKNRSLVMEAENCRQAGKTDRQRAIVSQTNTGTISKAKLGAFLRNVAKRTQAFPSA